MDPWDLQSSPRPFTRATIDDPTGLLGATTTSVGAVLYGPSGGPGVTNAYAGVEVTRKTAGKRVTSRSITLTTSAHAATYKTGSGNPWIATGTVAGVSTTENMLLTQTNGGETIRGLKLWDDPSLVTISNAGQNDALGAVSVGVGDIGGPPGALLRGFKAHAAGSVVLKGQDGSFDTAVMAAGAIEPTSCERICVTGGGDTTTAIGVTVYA